jgi:hypothetical protein
MSDTLSDPPMRHAVGAAVVGAMTVTAAGYPRPGPAYAAADKQGLGG